MAVEDELDRIDWYHTIELPGGRVTRGYWDERTVVGKLPMPESLAGRRCIDVAAADGFWTFEMARRGADLVLSTDLDDVRAQDWQGISVDELPEVERPGRAWRAFELAQGALSYPNIERIDVSAYDLNPEVHGTFDFAFMGNILLHLSDPARAVRAVRSVLAPGGVLLSFEAVSLSLSIASPRWPLGQLFTEDSPRWWTTNRAGHLRLLEAGGFEIVTSGFPVFQQMGSWRPRFPRSRPKAWTEVTFWLNRQFGLPSAWALVRPRPSHPPRPDAG